MPITKTELSLPEHITEPGLLITESPDDVRFFKALLSHLQCDSAVQFLSVRGVIKNLNSAWLRSLKAVDGFSSARVLGIIRDADENPRSALQSLCSVLGQAELPVPVAAGQWAQTDALMPQVGVCILPAADRAGALEDLCLQTSNEDPSYDELIQAFGTAKR